MIVIHDLPHLAHIFRIRVIGTGFSSGSGVFVKYDPLTKICGVFLIHDRREIRIKRSAHIGRHHFGILQRSP